LCLRLENDTLEGMVLRNGECGMKKALVAVDGSDKSLEAADYAMSMANKERAQLIILNVLDTEPWFYGQSANGWATEDELRKLYADEIVEREKILAKIKEKAEKINRPKF
jgi:nucleotide-binding universal stress UspA family protein